MGSRQNDSGKKKVGRPKADDPKTDIVSTRLDKALRASWDAFMADQEFPPNDATVVRAALRMFFESKGYFPPKS